MMPKVKWFFLDDLSLGLPVVDLADKLKKPGRYVQLVYFAEKNVTDIDTLRPIFELTKFKSGVPSFVLEMCPGYDEYFFIVFNSSIPHLLYHQVDRGVAQSMYRRIIKSFDIVVDHYAIYNGPERVPEEISRWEFVSLLTNHKFYTSKFQDLDSFLSFITDKSIPVTSTSKDPVVEIKELSFKNLSRV